MVKVRLARAGAKKRPYYHIVVTEKENPRDGRCTRSGPAVCLLPWVARSGGVAGCGGCLFVFFDYVAHAIAHLSANSDPVVETTS